jgi:two-component system NtrC family sensor kinase
VRDRIFDPFFTTRLGSGGSGLGLYISHNLVSSVLGGTLAVDGQPGQGVRFDIVLPKVAPAANSPGDASL